MQYKKQIIICSIFLVLNLIFVWLVLTNFLTLHQKLKFGLIRPDIIAVSMPMPENMSETEAQRTFEKLTSGFEQQYPGFGITLKIYTDSLQIPEDSDMYLDNSNPDLLSADISEIFREINLQNYFTNFTGKNTAIPLSFSIPALYYDMTDMNVFQKFAGLHSLDQNQLPENTVTDDSAFSEFLESPENFSLVLADTSRMFQIEQKPETSGRIHMIPVSENGSYTKIYHNLCEVNAHSDKNKQQIAMLWIAYLLSEEAQNILFTEHYGNLPLHQSAFDRTVSSHQAFYSLKDIRSALEEISYE